MQKVAVRKKNEKKCAVTTGYLNSDWFKCTSCGYTVRMLSLRDSATCSQCGGRMERIWRQQLYLSPSVISSVRDELQKYPNVETGGVFLGYRRRGHYCVLESICGGELAIRKKGTFVPDWIYINQIVRQRLKVSDSLCFLGIWHKHNHSLEPAFSKADIDMHNALLKANGYALSCLFQKHEDGTYAMQYIRDHSKPRFWVSRRG